MRLTTAIRSDSGVYPGDGAVGNERATWYSVASLRVSSGGIEVADLGAVPGPESIRVRLPNGTYVIEARLIDFNGSLCVSRVRVRATAVKNVSRGRRRGAVSVDFGAVVIADLEFVRQTFDDYDHEDFNEAARSFMDTEFCAKGLVRLGNKTIQFVVCKSGFGDGSYPVFSLVHRGRSIGLEVEFIHNGHVLAERKTLVKQSQLSLADTFRAAGLRPPKR